MTDYFLHLFWYQELTDLNRHTVIYVQVQNLTAMKSHQYWGFPSMSDLIQTIYMKTAVPEATAINCDEQLWAFSDLQAH